MPVSSHPDRERAPIVFGHKTALAILRSAAPRTLPPVAGKARVLPSRAPARGEVEAAIEHLEASYPDLRLERPAHVLVGSAALGRPSKAVKSFGHIVLPVGRRRLRLRAGPRLCPGSRPGEEPGRHARAWVRAVRNVPDPAHRGRSCLWGRAPGIRQVVGRLCGAERLGRRCAQGRPRPSLPCRRLGLGAGDRLPDDVLLRGSSQ